MAESVKVLLMGPPGSGKGTQGVRLAQRLGVEHIAAGELLRAEVAERTDIGRRVSALLDKGELVPDAIVLEMVIPRVRAAADAGGYLLDGFPRTVDQAVEARRFADSEQVAPNVAIYLDVERDELRRRVLERARLLGRTDDNETTVENRLRVFAEVTRPLVDFYRERGLLHVVDAAKEPEQVTEDILAVLRTEV